SILIDIFQDDDDSPIEARPPNYSPSDPKNKPSKKTKKQEADAKRLATLHKAKAKKLLAAAFKSEAAEEAAKSSAADDDAGGGGGEEGEVPTDVDSGEEEQDDDTALFLPKRGAKGQGKKVVVAGFVAPFNRTGRGKRAAPASKTVEAVSELPPLKRMRTRDMLNVVPVEGERPRRNQAPAGEPTGEFNDSYWQGVEKSQDLVDEWCKRLGIDQAVELSKRHGQGLRSGPLRRSYLVDLCAVAQRQQRKQLDPSHDAKTNK
ncbi:hypothetical protein P7C70_g8901, partial [Phenoliferia sp. Uapishka_3]